jgi:general secretion pathway protein H
MTSATGISDHTASFGGTCPASVRGSAGFTLVELMVAILIIGIASAALVLTMPDSQDRPARVAERLAARAAAARDLAIISGRPVRLTADETGLTATISAQNGWQAPQDTALARAALPGGLTLSADPAGPVEFDATGLATPARLVISGAGAAAAVTIDAGGGVRAGPA